MSNDILFLKIILAMMRSLLTDKMPWPLSSALTSSAAYPRPTQYWSEVVPSPMPMRPTAPRRPFCRRTRAGPFGLAVGIVYGMAEGGGEFSRGWSGKPTSGQRAKTGEAVAIELCVKEMLALALACMAHGNPPVIASWFKA